MKALLLLSLIVYVSGMRLNDPKSRSRRAELIAKDALSQILTELDVVNSSRESLTPTRAEIEDMNNVLSGDGIETFSTAPCGRSCAACGKCPATIHESGGFSAQSEPPSLNMFKNMLNYLSVKDEEKAMHGILQQTHGVLWNPVLCFLFVLIV